MSTRLLALDTTSEFGSLALVEDGHAVEEILLHSPDGFGHILFGQLQRLLDRHDWQIRGIDCFASAAGPGSFTGVRIGLAAIKGLAEAAHRPAIAVSNLEAVASFGQAPLRAALLDARRGDVYAALYDAALHRIGDEVVAKFPHWLASLPQERIEFLTPDPDPFRLALAASRFASCTLAPVPRAMASAVGRIAYHRFLQNEANDPAAIDANYVRRSDAELFWRE